MLPVTYRVRKNEPISHKQQRVIEKAKIILKKESWFKEVCIDRLVEDSELTGTTEFNKAVDILVQDTRYFDGPYLIQGEINGVVKTNW